MFLRLVLAFTLIPPAELYLLIRVGQAVGALNTIALVVVTAFIGAALTRRQGLNTLHRIRASLSQGMVPAGELIDAVLIFVAGVVLITPGFLTDSVGFMLLIPQARAAIKRRLRNTFRDWVERGNIDIRS